MSFGIPFFSLGFLARFIVAFIIIAYLYSKNKTEPAIRKGFVLLIALGAAVIVLEIIAVAVFMITGGAAFLGKAIGNFHHYF